MTRIAGIFDAAATADSRAAERVHARLTGHGRRVQRAQTHGAWTLAAGRGLVADAFSDPTGCAVIVGDCRWSNAEVAQDDRENAAEWLLRSYRHEGRRALDHLKGSFSLAVFDGARQAGLLATDRLGIQPLCYAMHGTALVFGSDATLVRCFDGIAAVLDPQSIFNYLYFHQVPAPGSVYRGCQRLLPGTLLEWHAGRIETHTYWRIRYADQRGMDEFDSLKSEFRRLLASSVARAAGQGRVGAFLSGGTDSSTVTGYLGVVRNEPAATYSIGFDAAGYDEMSFARTTARHFATRHHEYYLKPDDIVDAVPQIAAAYGEPFGNSSAIPAYYCARLAAAEGVERLLAGDGGDELFGGNARYARQYGMSFYERLPRTVRRLLEQIPATSRVVDVLPPLRKLRSFVEQAHIPMPERLETYNLLMRIGPATVLTPEFLAEVDLNAPADLMRTTYQAVQADSLIDRMLGFDHKFTLADNDLPKVSRTCDLAGIDVTYPLLDDELVAFSATLRPELKLKGFKLRFFFKEALRDFLPPEVITKKKQGFGMPFGVWLDGHARLREFVRENLEGLRGRGIVRPQFIDELYTRYLPEHLHYYGGMVWLLLMLEQWYRSVAQANRG
jgi:asparagine synthase (glutamine-hydrolysing)